MLENGTIIDGKYEVLSKIGQGGMSVIYLAMNKKANKQWAIKEVRKNGVKDFEVVKQGLIVETDILKKLNHPNLPSIIDIIETDGTFLIIMDYIQGKPLSDQLSEYGAQPQEYVIEWAKQLCDVLIYLHSRNPAIIYRDMKPSNVMLKPEGTITLIDFGTAREYKESNLADTTCLGTQGYAAPEQFGGQGQTDVRTDIYCLGATLYHLVTGHNPCEPPYEIYPIRQWNSSLSSGLENIIIKCTQRNPNDRYQSCAELLYALEHYEEIDDVFRKKQKKRMTSFVVSASLTLIFALTSIFGLVAAGQTKNLNYNTKMESAEKATDQLQKEKLYLDAIDIDPSKEKAYMALLEEYTSDAIFSVDEEQQIHKLTITSAQNSNKMKLDYLKDNKVAYSEFCYELGTAYWFCYEKPENKQVAATTWFLYVVNNSSSSPQNKSRANLFSEIGKFYKDNQRMKSEGNDEGMYKKYWDNLIKLKKSNDASPDKESVTRRLYSEIINDTFTYTEDFKDDHITKAELINTINDIKTRLTKTNTTQDKVKQEIAELLLRCDETSKRIDATYNH